MAEVEAGCRQSDLTVILPDTFRLLYHTDLDYYDLKSAQQPKWIFSRQFTHFLRKERSNES